MSDLVDKPSFSLDAAHLFHPLQRITVQNLQNQSMVNLYAKILQMVVVRATSFATKTLSCHTTIHMLSNVEILESGLRLNCPHDALVSRCLSFLFCDTFCLQKVHNSSSFQVQSIYGLSYICCVMKMLLNECTK